MREARVPDPDDPPPSALDDALRAIPDQPVPDGLLDSCLATVPGRAGDARRGLAAFAKLAAAAVILVAVVGYALRPRSADAATLLRAVKDAWTTVAASHQVVRIEGPSGNRTEETWVVRHAGYRKEVRSGGDLVGVIVRGRRWEYHWDVPGRTVAAWSTGLAPASSRPGEEGLVLDADGFEEWARSHRAEISVEPDTLAGRKAQKVVLRWPGATGTTGGRETATVWFDPASLLPLKQRTVNADGLVIEAIIDYPAPGDVPADRLGFTVPRDVLLEVNDPELGRQLYSDGVSRGAATSPTTKTQGVKE